MSVWQKCPVCEGSGKNTSKFKPNDEPEDCGTCNGTGIISQVSGKPPKNESKDNGDGPDKDVLKG